MALATALGLLFIAGLFSRFVDATWTAQGDTSSHSVTFSTFFGGSDMEFAQGITVDSLGNIYMVGGTRSSDFPVTRQAFQSIRKGDADAFLAKLSADGSRVLWSTLLGGSAKDYAHGVFVDEQGHVYVTGVTLSRDFPTTGHAYQRNLKGNKDVFVAKFARDGSLVFSTLVGGSGGDGDRGEPYADGAGNVYVATATESPDFPTTAGVLQRKLRGTRDVAVFVLSPDGSRLQRSCLFGGSGFDDPWGGIHVHSDGSIYVSGSTTSKDLPTTSAAFQRAYGGGTGEVWIGDSFVTRLSSDCSKLIYSGYLGGEGDDRVSENHGMAVDGSGRAIIAGHTNSKRFPITEKALQKSFGGGTYDGFV
ncbi:MAG TPA: SBBP repeat-containing protein, partial [Terriglobales bacterium]|nr:SBBP repeat-containing protein [Terriglobales bacterium]